MLGKNVKLFNRKVKRKIKMMRMINISKGRKRKNGTMMKMVDHHQLMIEKWVN